MTPSALAKAVRALKKTDRIRELPGTLTFFCPLSGPQERDTWLSLEENRPPFVEGISIVYKDTDIPLSKGTPVDPKHTFFVTIRKKTADGELRFLLVNALLQENAGRIATASLIRVAEMEAQETFSTLLARFEGWTVDAGAPYASSEPLACSPQKLARTYGNEEVVCADLRPWLLRSAPAVPGEAYAQWKQLASRWVLAALSNEVSVTSGTTTYVFTGPPKRSLEAPTQFDDTLADELQAAAQWVYVQGRDPEARHILFSNELARAHNEQLLTHVVKRSLESAESGYNAHVKSGSRETLKALADLRKAVFEETQKISQRAQDLAGSLWKDVAIAAAPFVLKMLPDTKASEPIIMAAFPLAAAAFLTFSFSVQVYVNYRFFKHQDTTREVWKRALAIALSTDEIEQLSERPVRDSLRDYRRVRLAVFFVYLALVWILVWVGISHMPVEWLAWIDETYQSVLKHLDRARGWIGF
ncbi:MAG: hypothetical protein EPO10_01035 [Reyranella sp.]|nr:MAG: hypothetical protein EPO10_01035 [Reyranella sp.]